MYQAFTRINWKVFGVLLAAGMAGVAAILPFAMDLVRASNLGGASGSELPLAFVILLALVQNGILLAAAILIGLVLSERIGLRFPLISTWASGGHSVKLKPIVLPGLLAGAAVGVALVVIEALFFLQRLPAAMLPLFEISLWKRLLAGVGYGGLTEEILMRLCLLSVAAWLLGKVWKTREGMPTPGAFRGAIILVALVFGLGHLPATAAITPLTSALVVRAVVLNGVAGVVFGYLFWRKGLEAAMLAHMSAHVVMQVPGVMLLRAML